VTLTKFFGSNGRHGALQYLLDELKKVGLEPNLKKFQAYATPPAAAAVPPWLKRPSYITCPVLRAEVEDTKKAAKEAAAAVKKARGDEKEAATAAAEAAAKAADNAMKSVPEQHTECKSAALRWATRTLKPDSSRRSRPKSWRASNQSRPSSQRTPPTRLAPPSTTPVSRIPP
jgi:hypothetical protein